MDGLRLLVESCNPDIIVLQETKVIDELFPTMEISALGYPHQAIHGIKAYNGVAILSKFDLENPEIGSWCGRADGRHIFARVRVRAGQPPLEVHSLYVPAGGDKPDPIKNPKFAHKLQFLEELSHWWAARGPADRTSDMPPRLMAGDFNVAPLPSDVWSHERLKNIVTHTEIEITHLENLRRSGGWTDAIRHFLPEGEHLYTWWSYRTPEWSEADKGRRLDHIWVSRELESALASMHVLKEARDWAPPSDHVPVVLEIDESELYGTKR